MLLCVTACCSVLQCVAVCHKTNLVPYHFALSLPSSASKGSVAVCCGLLQCVAVCCGSSQCDALCHTTICVAVCCSVLQRAAECCIVPHNNVCCIVLQFVAVCHTTNSASKLFSFSYPCSDSTGIFQTVCCSVLQCVLACIFSGMCVLQGVRDCNTLQYAATYWIGFQYARYMHALPIYTATHCNPLQHTAIHCNTLQYTATHYITLQHTTTHCNTLQHTATHCNTLEHTRVIDMCVCVRA